MMGSSRLFRNRLLDFALYGALLMVALFYVFLSIKPCFFSPKSQCLSNFMSMEVYEEDELERALAETATENRTVIIAVVNEAYVEGDNAMLDLFMDAFWLGEGTQGLRDHLLVVAADQTSYDRCKFLRLHCYRLENSAGEDLAGEKLYMSAGFIDMMWRRTQFLGDVLRRGYNFIFTDTDVMWFRNPFTRFSLDETIDMQISCDHFNGDEWSTRNPINTGLYMIRSNNKTIALFDAWYSMKANSIGLKEQDVLAKLFHNGVVGDLGVRVRFLDTCFFSGFCQNNRDIKSVVTFHANCCRSISAKLADLTAIIHDWKRSKNLPSNQTTTFQWSNHTACIKSWKY
ncbi:uncharacterized protein At1g28695-like isoform X1 [Diospyros lotus]|uniref:uncharacterized protein At1g28695-like isoform X1 n=1 Tax=Diospyros lotus TaxID=55363 RepID=UPI00225494EE|nr:uncharacterized protein At1g28695-like isoform X1 [Diospyros lotus]